MMDPGDKLSACILRVRTRMPFFGALALFLRHGFDDRVPTACTDGKEVLFNPDFAGALTSADLDAEPAPSAQTIINTLPAFTGS